LKARLPVPAELLGPAHRVSERRGAQAAEVLPPRDAATHEIGPLQHAHVLGGGWERHPQRRGELAEVALPARELPDDRAAGRVRERVEDEVEPRGLIYYHVVYYTIWFHDSRQKFFVVRAGPASDSWCLTRDNCRGRMRDSCRGYAAHRGSMMSKRPRKHLTRREREIVDAVFALGNRASVEDIRSRLTEPPGDSAIRVMLGRLERKGAVKRQPDGLRNLYSAAVSPTIAKRSALQHYLQTFFGGSLTRMMKTLVAESSFSEAELDDLRLEIERVRKERRAR
jgi:predicted transcriptional regulator